MRRVIGLVLAGLGTFLIVVAVLLPTWVASNMIKFPLNEYQSATLIGTNVQYFSERFVTEETGVTMRAVYTIKGVANAGNASTAVWDEFSDTYDVTNAVSYQDLSRRAAFDRRTGQLVNCCDANLNGDSSIRQTGVVGWVFPIGTQKQTYQVFDTMLNKPEPYLYSGTDTTDGISTYKYIENVAPTQFGTVSVPGYFVGSKSSSVMAQEFYQTHVVYWVDPETGALLNVNEFEEVTLHNPVTGLAGLVVFKGDMVETPSSLQAIVNQDNNGRNELSLVTVILPLVVGVVGVLCLVAGVWLARKRGDTGAEAVTIPLSAAAPAVTADSAAPAEGAGSDVAKVGGVNGQGADHVPDMDGHASGSSAGSSAASSPGSSPADPPASTGPDAS